MGIESLPTVSEARDLDRHLASTYARRNRFWAGGITKSPFYNLLAGMETASREAAKLNWPEQQRHVWLLRSRRELRNLFSEFDIRSNHGELEVLRFYLHRC